MFQENQVDRKILELGFPRDVISYKKRPLVKALECKYEIVRRYLFSKSVCFRFLSIESPGWFTHELKFVGAKVNKREQKWIRCIKTRRLSCQAHSHIARREVSTSSIQFGFFKYFWDKRCPTNKEPTPAEIRTPPVMVAPTTATKTRTVKFWK